MPRPKFLRGDPNDSGEVDLSDAIYTLGCLFLGTACATCPDAMDTNSDGELDLSDAIYTLQWLFNGGPAPPAPGGKECGVDPDPDDDAFDRCESTICAG